MEEQVLQVLFAGYYQMEQRVQQEFGPTATSRAPLEYEEEQQQQPLVSSEAQIMNLFARHQQEVVVVRPECFGSAHLCYRLCCTLLSVGAQAMKVGAQAMKVGPQAMNLFGQQQEVVVRPEYFGSADLCDPLFFFPSTKINYGASTLLS